MKMTMADDTKTKMIAFVFGDISVMLWTTINGILADFGHFGIQVASTIIIGLAGGLAGMVAKDIYPRIKKALKR